MSEQYIANSNALTPAVVKAAYAFAEHGVRGYRPVLEGVHIQWSGDSWRVEATDSYKLCRIQHLEGGFDGREWDGSIVVSSAQLKDACKGKLYTLNYDEGENELVVESFDGKRTIKCVESNYPNANRLLPEDRELAVPEKSFCIERITSVLGAFQDAFGKKADVRMNMGKLGNVAEFWHKGAGFEMRAILMPTREDGDDGMRALRDSWLDKDARIERLEKQLAGE